MKPTNEEKIQHYREGVGENCLICGAEFGGTYTDSSHQIRCWQCGAPYQVGGGRFEEEWLEKQGLKKEDIAQHFLDFYILLPIFRDYWLQTEKRIPMGIYLGNPDYTQEEFESFYRWLHENKDKYYEEYQFDLQWARIEGVATGDNSIDVAQRHFKALTGHDISADKVKELFNLGGDKEPLDDTGGRVEEEGS